MIRRLPGTERRGLVLLAVVVVVVLLSLAAYRYNDLMTAESRATASAARAVQARSFAESGVAYTLALLAANPANPADGNPWDNPDLFQDIEVPAPAGGRPGKFSIISVTRNSSSGSGFRYGLTDEGGKLNVNGLLDMDMGAGEVGMALLQTIPNMTPEIAAAIIDWLDEDEEPREGGAENETYGSNDPPYRCKNGPLDSLEELLLVQGVTPELLFGADKNRNGVIDADETAGGDTLGWSAFLTVYSHNVNAGSDGQQRINANNTDLATLGEQLAVLGEELGMYILAYRLYGGRTSTDTTGETTDIAAITEKVQTDLGGGMAKPKKLRSLWDLVGSSVTVSVGTGPRAKRLTYNSPLNNPEKQKELLPLLMDMVSTTDKWDLAPRINITTAPEEILYGVGTQIGLTEEQMSVVLEARPEPMTGLASDDVFRSTAWLVTEGQLTPRLIRRLERFVTGQTQVYRFQVVGMFADDKPGPTARLEVIVDVNNGRPRIVSWRDLTELGRGFNFTSQP